MDGVGFRSKVFLADAYCAEYFLCVFFAAAAAADDEDDDAAVFVFGS